jgi:hypothetical protein
VKPREIPEDAPQEIIQTRPRIAGGDNLLEKYDQRFKEAEKKHRNIVSSFDRKYAVITHPFFIFAVFFVLGLIFIVSRYIKKLADFDYENLLVMVNADAQTAMSYLAAVIVTAVFTKFIDKKG